MLTQSKSLGMGTSTVGKMLAWHVPGTGFSLWYCQNKKKVGVRKREKK